MHAKDGDMIRQAFRQVGLGLPINGRQDHEIKIKDFPNVQVGNWKDWQPTKGGGYRRVTEQFNAGGGREIGLYNPC
jgi:hypothetical protein